MTKKDETKKLPEVMQPIPGFKVMDWLRDVRNNYYRLSVENPEAYRKEDEKAKRRLIARARREGKKVMTSQQGKRISC